jgi:hypothetical protein
MLNLLAAGRSFFWLHQPAIVVLSSILAYLVRCTLIAFVADAGTIVAVKDAPYWNAILVDYCGSIAFVPMNITDGVGDISNIADSDMDPNQKPYNCCNHTCDSC